VMGGSAAAEAADDDAHRHTDRQTDRHTKVKTVYIRQFHSVHLVDITMR